MPRESSNSLSRDFCIRFEDQQSIKTTGGSLAAKTSLVFSNDSKTLSTLHARLMAKRLRFTMHCTKSEESEATAALSFKLSLMGKYQLEVTDRSALRVLCSEEMMLWLFLASFVAKPVMFSQFRRPPGFSRQIRWRCISL